MLHPAIAVRNERTIQGKGLVATRPIAEATIVWAREPGTRVVSLAEVASLSRAAREALQARYGAHLPDHIREAIARAKEPGHP